MSNAQAPHNEIPIRALTDRCARAMHAVPVLAAAPVVPRAERTIEAIERSSLRWARLMGLVDGAGAAKLARIGCGRFAAFTYAAADIEVVQLGADLIAWLYLFDDACGEAGDRAMFAAVAAVVRGAAPTDGSSRFPFAIDDLCRRAEQRAGARWRQRFCATLEHYFAGCLREIPYRTARRVPSLRDYHKVRRASVGALPVFALLELDGELRPDEAAASGLLRLALLGAGLCAWVNDVYSVEKERRDGDPLNLVQVLVNERACGLADAFDAAAALYNRDVARFTSAARDLRARPCTAAHRRFIDGLAMWVNGNHAWTATSGRY